jgi:formylmethanofuran dehydrogenase subunit E
VILEAITLIAVLGLAGQLEWTRRSLGKVTQPPPMDAIGFAQYVVCEDEECGCLVARARMTEGKMLCANCEAKHYSYK